MDEDAQQRQRVLATTDLFKKTLMCGYYAVNHILSALGRPNLSELDMETTAHEMAERESSIVYNMDPNTVLDLAADPRGNYAADTLLHLLHSNSGLNVERWRPDQPVSSCVILLGSGDHWQAVLMDRDKQWFVLDRYSKSPIQNIMRFLNSRLANGAVYEVGILEQLPNPDYLDTLARPQLGFLTTRTAQEANTVSPPRKRRPRAVFASDFQGPVFQIEDPHQHNSQVEQATPEEAEPLQFHSNLTGVIFASDFQGPEFQFEGPRQPDLPAPPPPLAQWFENEAEVAPMDVSVEDVRTLLNDLVDAMTPPCEAEETPEPPRRSSRTKVQTKYYQSDEVERHDKAAGGHEEE